MYYNVGGGGGGWQFNILFLSWENFYECLVPALEKNYECLVPDLDSVNFLSVGQERSDIQFSKVSRMYIFI